MMPAMFVNRSQLPHLLEPSAYHDAMFAVGEREVLAASWHLVGVKRDLDEPGAFITADVAGVPVIVRNGSPLRAFVNVCAHRHSKVRSERCGVAKQLRCQYHGWAYDERGQVTEIPDRSAFTGLDERQLRLRPVQVYALADLIFVCSSGTAAPVQGVLAGAYAMLVEALRGTRLIDSWRETYQANWKIPVENSLESYHLPSVHTGGFSTPPDPGEMSHRLETTHTVFESFLEMQGRKVPYTHVHVFPGLTFSLTPYALVLQSFTPLTPTTSESSTYVYARPISGPLRLLRPFADRAIVKMTRKIQKEDQRLFAEI